MKNEFEDQIKTSVNEGKVQESFEKRLQAVEKAVGLLKDLPEQPVKLEKNFLTFKGNLNRNGFGSNFGGNESIEVYLKGDGQFYAKIFAALSSPERIKLIKLLLNRSASVKEIMEELGLKTTGQAYHHLNFLEKATLIEKDGNVYKFNSSRISCIVLLLAGAYTYSRKVDHNEKLIEE